MIINSDEIEDIIRATFGKRFTRNHTIQIADEQYFCPSLKFVKKMLAKNKVDKFEYIEEKFDCDDFAFILKAYFIKQAYKDKKRRYPYCLGIIMGKLLGDINHAINFVITDSLKFYLIEPQTDAILKPTKKDREIYSIYM